MAEDALIVFDMEKQKRINSEKKIDEHLALIKEDLDQEKQFIQPASMKNWLFVKTIKIKLR